MTVVVGALMSFATLIASSESKFGNLTGTIRLSGELPAAKMLYKKGDPKVRDAFCRKRDIPDESLMVNEKNKGIANIIVFLQNRPKGVMSPIPKKPAILTIRKCRMNPRIMPVRVGQDVQFRNSGLASHAFFGELNGRSRLDVGFVLRGKSSKIVRIRTRRKLPVRIGDWIHSWVSAYLLPLDHPFAAVTDENGKFKISGLPPGRHDFVVWHERAGYLQRKLVVRIEPGKNSAVSLRYNSSRFSMWSKNDAPQ